MHPLTDKEKYKFYVGDCLSVLKQLDSESVDSIITSPPYWGMRAYDNDEDTREIGNETNFADYVTHLLEVFTEAKRVLKSKGSFWLNIGDRYVNK